MTTKVIKGFLGTFKKGDRVSSPGLGQGTIAGYSGETAFLVLFDGKAKSTRVDGFFLRHVLFEQQEKKVKTTKTKKKPKKQQNGKLHQQKA